MRLGLAKISATKPITVEEISNERGSAGLSALMRENVWDYPRPAVCEPFVGTLSVVVEGIVIAESQSALRTLETSHPPTYYFPAADVNYGNLCKNERSTFCEWKGEASYFSYVTSQNVIPNIGWCYTNPTKSFSGIKGYISFYASKADACYVNGERVQHQEGDFYGGWITSNLVGPFKGGVGTLGW